MLTLRLIGVNDYSVREDAQNIGGIRLARERSPSIWPWNVTVTIPGPPFGDAKSLDQAKGRIQGSLAGLAWLQAQAWGPVPAKHQVRQQLTLSKQRNRLNRTASRGFRRGGLDSDRFVSSRVMEVRHENL